MAAAAPAAADRGTAKRTHQLSAWLALCWDDSSSAVAAQDNQINGGSAAAAAVAAAAAAAAAGRQSESAVIAGPVRTSLPGRKLGKGCQHQKPVARFG